MESLENSFNAGYSSGSLTRGRVPKTPLSPTDSVMSIGQFRPSLVWLFNHIRRHDKDALTKEDLRQLLGASVDNTQLNEAFENLDVDKDGEISLDEFLSGFSRFLREAPQTPGYDKLKAFTFTPQFVPPRQFRHEDYFETVSEPEKCAMNGVEGPSEDFMQSLAVLSSHNRHSIECIWKNLAESNAEMLGDFEEFVAEIANEVGGAQRALDQQRRVTKKEAIELDEEIESRLIAANTRLQIQTALARQQTRVKLEEKLFARETELMAVRYKLQELESEVVVGQKAHSELEEQYAHLHKVKKELQQKLEASEKQLEKSQTVVHTLQQHVTTHSHFHSSRLQEQEKELHQMKDSYIAEIAELREKLEELQQCSGSDSEEDVVLRTEATPDLLSTLGLRERRPSRGSLMDEIVKTEGAHSPLLRGEPLRHVASAEGLYGMSKRSSMSLPNLNRVNSLGALHVPVYIPVYVGMEKKSDPLSPIHSPSPTEDTGESPPPPPPPPQDHTTNPPPPTTLPGPGGHEKEEEILDPLRSGDSYFDKCEPLEFIENLASPPDYVFKILVVGNSYVGKSTFLMRLCTNAFSARYSSTIGVDFYSKALRVDDSIISVQLWDTAGQERYQAVTKAYYRGAQGVILMYDVSQEESFIAVKSWINSIQDNMKEMPVGMLLVGNKVDLDEQNEREVSTETGETFAKIYGADFMETSAKTGYNVATSLMMLIRVIKRYYEEESTETRHERGIQVNEKDTSSKCCSR